MDQPAGKSVPGSPNHRLNLGLERSRWKGQPSGLPADLWSTPGGENVAVSLLER